MTLLQAVVGEAALALDRTRSTAALGEALERERFVARISARVRSELDVDELLRVAVRETGRALGVDRCFIRLGDTEDALPIAAQWHAAGLAPIETGMRLAVSNLAVRRRETVAIDDVEHARALEDDDARWHRCTARARLPRRAGRADRRLRRADRRPRAPSRKAGRWTPEEIALTEAVAREIGLAVHVARLLRDNERRIAQQAAFFRIAAMLGQSLSLSATLDALAQAACDALGGDSAAVLMPRGGDLELAASVGLPRALSDALAAGLPAAAASLAAAATDRRTLASPDVSSATTVSTQRGSRCWRSRAFAPCSRCRSRASRQARCGLAIVFFARERMFTDEELEVARHLAEAARGALERSELFEAERTARALSQQLAQTGSVLATELDPAAVLDEVVQQAPALLAADACAVLHARGRRAGRRCCFRGRRRRRWSERAPSATAWLSGDVFQSRAPVASRRRLGGRPPCGRRSARRGRLQRVPGRAALRTRKARLPACSSVYARRPRTWRAEEVEALQALAGNTSAALANAELYSRVSLEKERSVAILANIADGIVAVDRDGRVVLWNAAAEQMTGVPQEEAIGRTTDAGPPARARVR